MGELVADISGAGSAVVLLHGQPGGRVDWAAVAGRLAAEYRVVVPDRPGYGDTGGRARGFRGNAAAVISLLDHLGIGRATVVGYSWAGGIALALAAENPGRVAALVLVSSVAPGDRVSRMDRMLAVAPIGSAVVALGLWIASGALALPPVRRSPGFAQRVRDGELGPEAIVSAWRSQRVWRSFVTEQQSLVEELPTLEPGLAAIAAPTVVVVGEADRMVPPASGRRLAAAISQSRLVALPGAGHFVVQQHPDVVVDAVRAVAPRPR